MPKELGTVAVGQLRFEITQKMKNEIMKAFGRKPRKFIIAPKMALH
jgi:hypothetical protein